MGRSRAFRAVDTGSSVRCVERGSRNPAGCDIHQGGEARYQQTRSALGARLRQASADKFLSMSVAQLVAFLSALSDADEGQLCAPDPLVRTMTRLPPRHPDRRLRRLGAGGVGLAWSGVTRSACRATRMSGERGRRPLPRGDALRPGDPRRAPPAHACGDSAAAWNGWGPERMPLVREALTHLLGFLKAAAFVHDWRYHVQQGSHESTIGATRMPRWSATATRSSGGSPLVAVLWRRPGLTPQRRRGLAGCRLVRRPQRLRRGLQAPREREFTPGPEGRAIGSGSPKTRRNS